MIFTSDIYRDVRSLCSTKFSSKVEESANGARYTRDIKARGKREAKRSASPLVTYTDERFRPERPKYAPYYAPSGLDLYFDSLPRGDALRACRWLLYLAPLALCYGFSGKAAVQQTFQSRELATAK